MSSFKKLPLRIKTRYILLKAIDKIRHIIKPEKLKSELLSIEKNLTTFPNKLKFSLSVLFQLTLLFETMKFVSKEPTIFEILYYHYNKKEKTE